jgi:hypothetical protein
MEGDASVRRTVPNKRTVRPRKPSPSRKKVNTPSIAIRFRYKGIEQTAELPVTPDTIAHLVLEAALRNMKIGELIAGLIAAIVKKDLFTLLLDEDRD